MRTRRSGVTLVEVLAAIMIMGIGMLAILVLFPLGALNMARALKDDRCGTIAGNADALAAVMDLRNDPTVASALGGTPAGFAAPDPNGPGYPVLVDGYYGILGAVPNLGNVPITRVKPDYCISSSDADRLFSFNDDLTFESDGRPKVVGTNLVRQGMYTWTYLLRRKKSSDATAGTDLTVLVYSGRPVNTLTSVGAEPSYSASGIAGSTLITLTVASGTPLPEINKGNWMLDGTFISKGTFGYVPANFYRVMSVRQASATQVEVDVDPPLVNGGTSLQMVVLPDVVEVFERGTGN